MSISAGPLGAVSGRCVSSPSFDRAALRGASALRRFSTSASEAALSLSGPLPREGTWMGLDLQMCQFRPVASRMGFSQLIIRVVLGRRR
jgi:hypothetical protein